MARKQLDILVSAEGRDKGKMFQITEMPASKAEKWAIRTMLALGKSGVEIPDDLQAQGMAGIASLGIRALTSLNFEDAEPLLAEMFDCVKCVPDPTRPEVTRALVEDDIEEVSTRLLLRKDILSLHIDFFTAVAP
jgi:hypothetical protein